MIEWFSRQTIPNNYVIVKEITRQVEVGGWSGSYTYFIIKLK